MKTRPTCDHTHASARQSLTALLKLTTWPAGRGRIQDLGDEPPLVMGNCPSCCTTLAVQVEAQTVYWERV